MTPEELELFIGGPAGYLGPVGIAQGMSGGSLNGLKSGKSLDRLKGVFRENPAEGLRTIIVLDPGLDGRTNLVAGANKLDYHLRNVTPGRDFTATIVADIRNINEGELDPIGGEPLRLGKAVEIGHIFKLGTKYSESMGARVLDANGKEVLPIMGCYGIGIERILTAAIESSAAANGGEQYALPAAIAPFAVIVTITNVREADLLAAGEKIAADLEAAGVDVLLDDRDERAGVKFKDAELIGVPYRINIGKKLAEGQVELVDRLTQTTTDLPLDAITTHIQSLLGASKL
jgi:prolyl-tRNA synthetase